MVKTGSACCTAALKNNAVAPVQHENDQTGESSIFTELILKIVVGFFRFNFLFCFAFFPGFHSIDFYFRENVVKQACEAQRPKIEIQSTY